MEHSLFYNSHFHQLIDWAALRELIAKYFMLEGSFEDCLTLAQQYPSRELTELHYQQTAWFLSLGLETQADIRQILESLRPHFSHSLFGFLAKGRVLDLEELRKAHGIFLSLTKLFSTLPKNDLDSTDFLHDFVRELQRNFLKKIELYLTPTGWDFAHHPQMGPVINKLAGIEKRLRLETTQLMKSDLYQSALQFDQYDVINSRFVIPIQSDHFKQEMGSIIAHSASGRTLFVEPFQVARLASERLELEGLIEALQYRFSTEVCRFFHAKEVELKNSHHYLKTVDQVQARAAFGYDYDLVKPEFTERDVFIEGFFHPLIARAVTNDLKLSSPLQSLIISGPNTGGKTVLLKSLAICFYFTHLGLYLPARSARLPFFKKIFFFSNDHQSLLQGLSSFASEAGQYLEILDKVDDDTCLFIDEIFNSTGSEEASALALGFFKRFFTLSDKCLIFVSTHHQLLKTLTHNHSPFLSGHMGFDTSKNAPTYRLYTGLPGSSMAFEIFKGLKDDIYKQDILDEASAILGKKKVTYEGLLTELSSKQAQLDSDLKESSRLKNELKNQKQASEGLLFLERQKVLDQYRKTIDQKMKRLEEIVRETRSASSKEQRNLIRSAQSISHEITPKQSFFNPQLKNPPPFELDPSQVKIGKRYRSLLFNTNVEVIAINERKKEAQIRVKGKSIWTALTSLAPLGHKETPAPQVTVRIERSSFNKLEIDGRGQRLEDFEREVSSGLDALLAEEIPFLTIIHGHGEGILKRWLRTMLASSGEFEWEPSEGNDGSTLIKVSR